MALAVRESNPRDLDAIIDLLCAAFAVGRDASFVQPDLLRWKYFGAARAPELPRSYVLEQDGAVLAHCGVVPLTLRVPVRDGRETPRVSAFAFMDWAGGRRLPGAGVILKKRLMALVDVALVVGGTSDTRAALPRIGFTVPQRVSLFARVVRPFRQAWRRPSTTPVRDAARLLRNVAWSLPPVAAGPRGWDVDAVDTLDQASEEDLLQVRPVHTPAFLDYWLRCPMGRTSAYQLLRDGERTGYALLTTIGGQVRISALHVGSADPAAWVAACRAVVATAARAPETCEVVCACTWEPLRGALVASGFRERNQLPLYVADPHGTLAGARPVAWSLIDNDLAYLHDPAHPFLT